MDTRGWNQLIALISNSSSNGVVVSISIYIVILGQF